MDYSEQYDYLKSKGCTFKWDEANPSWSFSRGHIMYKGSEIGTLEKDYSWISDSERNCWQFSYMGLYAHQDFKSKVDTTLLVIDSGMPLEMIKEKIKMRDAIHSYFESRKERSRR
jgi:hypothetical protein